MDQQNPFKLSVNKNPEDQGSSTENKSFVSPVTFHVLGCFQSIVQAGAFNNWLQSGGQPVSCLLILAVGGKPHYRGLYFYPLLHNPVPTILTFSSYKPKYKRVRLPAVLCIETYVRSYNMLISHFQRCW